MYMTEENASRLECVKRGIKRPFHIERSEARPAFSRKSRPHKHRLAGIGPRLHLERAHLGYANGRSFNSRRSQWGAAVYITVSTGLRKREVLALRWEDIEWSVPGFGELRVGRQVQRLGRGIGLLVRENVKTGDSEAVLPLPPLALAALERRRKDQSAELVRAPKVEVRRSMSEHDHFHWQGDEVRPGQNRFVFTSASGDWESMQL
jgi:integrase